MRVPGVSAVFLVVCLSQVVRVLPFRQRLVQAWQLGGWCCGLPAAGHHNNPETLLLGYTLLLGLNLLTPRRFVGRSR